jgi:hypothetical protein
LKGEHSDLTGNQFRVMVMITVLQRDLGVKYNLAFNEGDYDGRDSRNLFIHGLLTGHGGTCNTMPVLYTAIGRRLGWPLRLVLAKEHMFCRWDKPNDERFNIEATSPGFVSRPDEHYHHLPKPLSPAELERGWYLQSVTRREEVAEFYALNGLCRCENMHMTQAVQSFQWASSISPEDPRPFNGWIMATILKRAFAKLRWQSKSRPAAPALLMPAPLNEFERAQYPRASIEFNRILTNHRRQLDPDAPPCRIAWAVMKPLQEPGDVRSDDWRIPQ